MKELAQQHKKKPLVVLLDNLRSAHNVGAIFRCCDAFGVAELWLCGITAQPPHTGIAKTALGAENYVRWTHERRLGVALDLWKKRDYTLYAVETTADAWALSSFAKRQTPEDKRRKGSVLIFGHEVTGVSAEAQSLAHHALCIPQQGIKHSLNVSVAAGIVLYQLATASK